MRSHNVIKQADLTALNCSHVGGEMNLIKTVLAIAFVILLTISCAPAATTPAYCSLPPLPDH